MLKFLFVSMGLGGESGRVRDGRGGWESGSLRVRVRPWAVGEGARGLGEGLGAEESLSVVRSQVKRHQRREDTGSGRDGGRGSQLCVVWAQVCTCQPILSPSAALLFSSLRRLIALVSALCTEGVGVLILW